MRMYCVIVRFRSTSSVKKKSQRSILTRRTGKTKLRSGITLTAKKSRKVVTARTTRKAQHRKATTRLRKLAYRLRSPHLLHLLAYHKVKATRLLLDKASRHKAKHHKAKHLLRVK